MDSREVHDLVDLLGIDLAQRTAEDCEVLAEDEDLAPVDGAPSGNHAVGERAVVLDPEAMRPVARQHVELDEGAGIEQQVEPFAGGELAPLVLAPDRRLVTGRARFFFQLRQLVEPLGDRVRGVGHDGQASSRPVGLDLSEVPALPVVSAPVDG